MRRFILATLLTELCWGCVSVSADDPSPQPLMITATAPLGDLTRKLRYFTQATGEANTESFRQHWVSRLVNDGGIEGVDMARPAGTVFYMRDRPRSQPLFGIDFDLFPYDYESLGFVPVVNTDAFVDAIKADIAFMEEVTPGLWRVPKKPGHQSCLLKEADPWCIFANDKTATPPEGLPSEPSGGFEDLPQSYELALRLHPAGLPASISAITINEGSINEEFELNLARSLGSQWAAEAMCKAAQGLDHITVGLRILDKDAKGASIDVVFTPRAGTYLAEHNSALSSAVPISLPGFLLPDALLSLHVSDRLVRDEVISSLILFLLHVSDEGSEKKDLDDPGWRQMFDVFEKTLASGDDRDGCLSLSVVGEGPVTLVAGARTNQFAALTDAIEAVVLGLVSDPKVAGVSEQNEQMIDGMRLRTWVLDLSDAQENGELVRALGGRSVQVLLGVRAESNEVYLAAGHDAYGRLKAALDGSSRRNDTCVRLAELNINLRLLARFPELLDLSATEKSRIAEIERIGGALRVYVECTREGDFLLRSEFDDPAMRTLRGPEVLPIIEPFCW